MNRFGDTPAVMVESALEFARIARSLAITILFFDEIVEPQGNESTLIGC